MIDLHCHILPRVDDGATTLTESLIMAKEAEKEGITTIVATPHHKNGTYDNVKKDIIAGVADLNKELKDGGINVEILPGQEIRIYGELMEDYEKDELLTIGGDSSYVLIEFPSGYVPQYAEQLFFDMQMKGLLPIIVHPERNQELIEKPDRLYNLVKNGAATQITASSYIGKFGKKIQMFTEQLIDANLTHLFASDAHNVKNRSFHMAQAHERLQKRAGTDYVYYFKENAELIVNGQHMYKEPPERIRTKKKFLGLF
ncbi:tyrosine protein phosphatase [Bacillus aerolatus]|uniref:Tyrosine-protein phosphatase n=1 Tax=Bacillus aerolatus TaxID=2653354 RepID=A0A6I1FKV8_9BACI|nr:CpsB/CapC family capsule biosynthesis tyrosine phosphatase [Bacillus aerolatus]KAB7707384.1 tyrosine protein phosphatase [Bacillus aerolatus]